MEFNYINGQTPLEEEEKEGLLIPTVATHGELNEFEQQNIEQAVLWLLSRPFKADEAFTENFIRGLHKRMYGNVWAWAGNFRKTNKNIGVDKWEISTALKTLLDDAKFWYTHNIYSADETTIRFKHRLVSIHCFPNGNGRHSRLMADIIIEKIFKQPMYTWGASNEVKQRDMRTAYLRAIKAADNGDVEPLIHFARL
jgi:Fic-DOC domain mobile mystery protein B